MENTRLKWREAFVFTRSELRGFRVLTVLLALTAVVRIVYFRWVPPPAIAISIPTEWISSDSITPEGGLSFHQRSKRFTHAAESSGAEADTLEPHVYPTVYRRSRMVELNSADTIELRSLPAIGPYLARKIVEYRERLGGYFSADQLLEVYRLSPGKLDTISPFLVIDTTLVRRIDMNSVSLEELLKHPYVSRSQARGLLAYREKHGPFGQLSDLKKCLLIDEITFEKLRDYVEVR